MTDAAKHENQTDELNEACDEYMLACYTAIEP